jgi:excisionase family DNA binding protein
MAGQKNEKMKRVSHKGKRRTLSVIEAAEILGISRAGAYRLVKSGELPTIRLGTRVLVTDTIIERLLAGA